MDVNVTVAVVGCGHWGPNHIRAFSSLPGARVTRAVDPDASRREHIQRAYPAVLTSSDLEPALDDDAVSAVVVAAPAATHYEITSAALSARKHVLCEKPLCLTSQQCQALEALARRQGVILMVGHIFLFNSGILKIKELIAGGELGRLQYVTAVRTNLGPVRQDVNAAYDLASHEVSIFNHLFDGVPERVSAVGRACLGGAVEDVVFLTMWYPDGLIANVTASWLSPKKVREITLVGDRKMVVWNDMAADPVSIYDQGAPIEPYYENFGEFQLSGRKGDVTIPRLSSEEPLRSQAQFFIDAIKTGSASICGPECAWEVVRTLEAIDESIRQGGRPTPVGGPARPREVERSPPDEDRS